MPTFRNNKKNSADGDSAKPKKTSSRRRLRGLLTGESRRERKAKRAAEREAAIKAGETPVPIQEHNPDDEEETVYGVNVDDSVQTSSQSILPSPKAEDDDESTLGMGALQVILLLMDPATRRFELLQLEFDSQSAVVRDVLAQVPHSVTEEALRKQNYSGVCDRSGQELYYSTCLGDVCTGSDILIALPENLDGKECARLARPILSDNNVIEMLRSSGIDVSNLIDTTPVTPEAPQNLQKSPSPEQTTEKMSREVKPSSPPPSKRGLFIAIFIILCAVGVQVVQMSVTAPLGPGQSLSQNAFMSKCGYKAFLPGGFCEEFSLIMSNDNALTLYGSDGEIAWQIVGEPCEDEADVCEGGLHFNEDKTLTIAGKIVRQATVYGDEETTLFAPFPFTEPPKLKVIKGKN